MEKFLHILSISLIFLLCSCLIHEEGILYDDIYIVEAPQKEDVISLQNLKTKEIVHCHATKQRTAEECAATFESNGYVRFRDIPSQTAEYDSLQTNTYPSRRWRKGEKNPRW